VTKRDQAFRVSFLPVSVSCLPEDRVTLLIRSEVIRKFSNMCCGREVLLLQQVRLWVYRLESATYELASSRVNDRLNN
jgi:hypothetical protein